ncbi:MAG: hypothetical protein H6861_05120 [Rhodospirillales bacterium]|nr:hypothetical protein [Rhodospirillales bacterium]
MARMKDIRAAQRAAATGNPYKKKVSPKKLSREENQRRIHGNQGDTPEIRQIRKILRKEHQNFNNYQAICKKATSDPHSSITAQDIDSYTDGADIKSHHIPPLKHALQELGLFKAQTKPQQENGLNGEGISDNFWRTVKADNTSPDSNDIDIDRIAAVSKALHTATGIHVNKLKTWLVQGIEMTKTLEANTSKHNNESKIPAITVRLRPDQQAALVDAYNTLDV